VSTLTYALTDSRTMLRRTLRRMVRYPSMTVLVIGLPLVLMLLFVYVFGGTLGAGLGGVAGGRQAYLNYLVPGILTITIAGVAQGTAISIAMDMAAGIIARFRTMAISRSSVLAGHVLGALIQNVVAVVIILGVALLIGFRPTAGPLEWLGVAGMVLLLGLAVTWLSVALGLQAKSVETASNTPMLLMLLPFLGSGFVPTASLPVGLRWFAQYQPFTPVTETLRALLTGSPIGSHAIVAVAWCVAIALGSYLWAVRLFNRFPRKARWLNTGPA
jgi:ABC-2 type transport system permease protein